MGFQNVFKRGKEKDFMMFKKVSTVVVIGGLVLLAAGFVPLTRTIPEETETGSKKEVLLRGPISVAGGSTSGISFELAAGDVIIFKAHADDDMMVSFIGQKEFYMSMEIGSAIEEIYKDDLADHCEILSEHFYQSENYAKAADYSKRAARKAEKGATKDPRTMSLNLIWNTR